MARRPGSVSEGHGAGLARMAAGRLCPAARRRPGRARAARRRIGAMPGRRLHRAPAPASLPSSAGHRRETRRDTAGTHRDAVGRHHREAVGQEETTMPHSSPPPSPGRMPRRLVLGGLAAAPAALGGTLSGSAASAAPRRAGRSTPSGGGGIPPPRPGGGVVGVRSTAQQAPGRDRAVRARPHPALRPRCDLSGLDRLRPAARRPVDDGLPRGAGLRRLPRRPAGLRPLGPPRRDGPPGRRRPALHADEGRRRGGRARPSTSSTGGAGWTGST